MLPLSGCSTACKKLPQVTLKLAQASFHRLISLPSNHAKPCSGLHAVTRVHTCIRNLAMLCLKTKVAYSRAHDLALSCRLSVASEASLSWRTQQDWCIAELLKRQGACQMQMLLYGHYGSRGGRQHASRKPYSVLLALAHLLVDIVGGLTS